MTGAIGVIGVAWSAALRANAARSGSRFWEAIEHPVHVCAVFSTGAGGERHKFIASSDLPR